MAQTAIVTGGTGGLGAAVTEAFVGAGWQVVVPWIVEKELSRVRANERVELVRADLMDPDGAAAVVGAAGGAPAALVNLVGGFAAGGRAHETPVEDFEAQLRLNLRPTFLMCAAAIPAMLDAGRGAIVCVSSRAALQPFPGAAGSMRSTPSTATTASGSTRSSPRSSTRRRTARRCRTRTSRAGCSPPRSRRSSAFSAPTMPARSPAATSRCTVEPDGRRHRSWGREGPGCGPGRRPPPDG